MRIWSIHPKYLDTKGLVVCWRESLLAKNVLEGKTTAYSQHPQLFRFKSHPQSIEAIHFYLSQIYDEAERRSYRFDPSKFIRPRQVQKIPVTDQQLQYEGQHLMNKLYVRDPKRYQEFLSIDEIEAHPIFSPIQGPIESWEIISV